MDVHYILLYSLVTKPQVVVFCGKVFLLFVCVFVCVGGGYKDIHLHMNNADCGALESPVITKYWWVLFKQSVHLEGYFSYKLLEIL